MADTIYIFHKTLEQRLEEFKDILCSRSTPVLASDVADEWSYSLENFLEPTGWQALWKISRQICEELNIMFPKFVFVKVLCVDFRELTAFVDVEKVQDNISIPGKQEVPLVQLYPTKIQEDPVLNVDCTANFIDQLRFFYNHLWCPWDVEDVEGGEWSTKFLESRLQLFYDMNDGKIPAKLADKIHKRREQARKLFGQKQELERQLQKSSIEEQDEEILSPSSQDHTFALMQVHLQLNPMITELQLLENPSMRKLVIKKFIEEEGRKRENSGAIAVWETGTVDGFIDFLTDCKNVLGTETCIESASSLQSAIESAVCGNTILLHQGVHKLNHIIESTVYMIGVGSVTPIIAGKESNSYLFSVRNAAVKFKNVKLDVRKVANALQILKKSTVELINCTITNEESPDGRGIVVNSGGSVVIKGCCFSGLHVAVCCCAGSQVCIENTIIKNCAFGIEAYESSELQITGGSIENCNKAGLFISQSIGTNERGNLDLLKKFQKINVSDLQLVENVDNVVLKAESNSLMM